MLTDLLPSYKTSKKLLNNRINELTVMKHNLESASFNPTEDPDVIEVKQRILPLVNMYTDLAEVAKEIENYYKKTKVISMGHNKEPSHNPFAEENTNDELRRKMKIIQSNILKQLTNKQKEAVLLHYQGKSYSQIAETMGTNKTSAAKKVAAALKKIEEIKNFFENVPL